MTDFTTEPCRSCDAPIIWATSAKTGKNMPVNAEPVKGGTIALDWSHDGTVRANVLSVRQLAGASFGRPLRSSHFATCPQARQWRNRGGE